MLVTVVTGGNGFTKTVAVDVLPTQPLAVGVIVKVTDIAAAVEFVKLPLILPLPLATIPVTEAVLSLVQVYVVPLVELVNTIVVMVLPEHIVWLDGVRVVAGEGFTNTVAAVDVPEHPLALGVIVKVTVTGLAVVFVSVPLISPLPLAPIPVTEAVLFLVHV